MSARVTVWNEYWHERREDPVRRLYPRGIHHVIGEHLAALGMDVTLATMDEPSFGLPDAVIDKTDVLVWWSHLKNDEVDDAVVDKLCVRVLNGMGFIALHSAKYSKLFMRLLGTSARSRWRVAGEKERVWVVLPSHPIATGIGDSFVLSQEEMYGEPSDMPPPDEVVFVSWFEGGDVCRSGVTYHRGAGRIFYFRPGHEEYPSLLDRNVQRIIANAVQWCADGIAAKPQLPAIATLSSEERNTPSIERVRGAFVDGRGNLLDEHLLRRAGKGAQ